MFCIKKSIFLLYLYIKIDVFKIVSKFARKNKFLTTHYIFNWTVFYSDILWIACIGSTYGDFEGVIGLRGINLYSWHVWGAYSNVIRAYTSIYLKFQYPNSKKESRTHPTFLKRSQQTSAAIPIICCTLHSEKKTLFHSCTKNASQIFYRFSIILKFGIHVFCECSDFEDKKGSGEISPPSWF